MVRLVNGLGSPERAIQFAGLVFKPVPVESTDRFFVLETVYNQEDQTPEGIRVNLAVATEDNFGSVLMYRTGNRAFNIYLANRAQTRGLFWSPFANSTSGEVPDGLFDPSTKAVMASRTEEDIFKALKLPFVEPKDRERK
jgi:DNA polymerase/3'-5' exonuclease PolX